MIKRLLSGAFHPGDEVLSKGQVDRPVRIVYVGKFDSVDGEVTVTTEDIERLC